MTNRYTMAIARRDGVSQVRLYRLQRRRARHTLRDAIDHTLLVDEVPHRTSLPPSTTTP